MRDVVGDVAHVARWEWCYIGNRRQEGKTTTMRTLQTWKNFFQVAIKTHSFKLGGVEGRCRCYERRRGKT